MILTENWLMHKITQLAQKAFCQITPGLGGDYIIVFQRWIPFMSETEIGPVCPPKVLKQAPEHVLSIWLCVSQAFSQLSGKQLNVLRAKAGSIVPAGGKTGKWRWSGLISFVSRCIHFVFFPTPTPPLSVKPLIRNWTPQWQIEPAIKGRKRKALLSAADWDPRLPSHNRGGYLCVCVCAYMRMLGSEPIAELTPPPLLPAPQPPLSRCSHGLHVCSECSANKTKSMQPFSHHSLSHTYIVWWNHKGKPT